MPKEGYKPTFIRWDAAGGSVLWVRKDTLSNVDKVHKWLEEKTDLSAEKRSRFSYSQISKGTGIGREQVSRVCWLMGWSVVPMVRIHAVKYPMRGSAQISQKVELLYTFSEWRAERKKHKQKHDRLVSRFKEALNDVGM